MAAIEIEELKNIAFGNKGRLVFTNSATLQKQQVLVNHFLSHKYARLTDTRRSEPGDDQIYHNLIPLWYQNTHFVQLFSESELVPKDELPMLDGALFCISCEQTSMNDLQLKLARDLLRFAIQPSLVLENLHKILHLSSDAIYERLFGLVKEFEQVVQLYAFEEMKPMQPSSIVFSGNEWGFTIAQFETLYNTKFAQPVTGKLWGEWYYDQQAKSWQNYDATSTLKRSFCTFVLEPIKTIYELGMANVEQTKLLMKNQLSIAIPDEKVTSVAGADFVKYCLKTWLPLDTTIMQTIVSQLPTVGEAQAYRYKYLCKQGDILAVSIKNPSKDGPLVAYCSNHCRIDNSTRYVSIIRVFSGSIYFFSNKYRLVREDQVIKLRYGMFNFYKPINFQEKNVTFGCIFYIHPIFAKGATIVDETMLDVSPLRAFSAVFKPILEMTFAPANPADITKLQYQAKSIVSKMVGVQYNLLENGDYSITAATESVLHATFAEINQIAPMVMTSHRAKYMETISAPCTSQVFVKSLNKHNRVYMTAKPLPDDFVFCNKTFKMQNIKELAQFGFSDKDISQIVAIENKNIVSVIGSSAILASYKEIASHVEVALQWCCKEGPMTDSQLVGVHFIITDMILVSDAIHRGGGQIIPTMRRFEKCSFFHI